MDATADRVPCVFIENNKVSNYDSQSPIFVDYQRNFDGEPTGLAHPELLTKQRSSHGHNQSIVNGIGRIGYMKGGGKALWRDEDIADRLQLMLYNLLKPIKITHSSYIFVPMIFMFHVNLMKDSEVKAKWD